jgi:hypothetical protein
MYAHSNNMTIQEHLLLIALRENNIENYNYIVDHVSGTNIINDIQYPLIFPMSMIRFCESMWSKRTLDFYFKGLITPKRQWCNDYIDTDSSMIISSSRGRNPSLKYTRDIEYYESLGKCKYALAPTGDCPWSYRFFEGIMCGAIPVLGDDDHDVYADKFTFYRHSSDKYYDEKHVKANFDILKVDFTLEGCFTKYSNRKLRR